MKVKITRPTVAKGAFVKKGETLEVSDEEAIKLIRCKKAEKVEVKDKAK